LGVITKQLHEQPLPPSERRANVSCPAALEAVILRGLRKNKEDRFANAGDMKLALLESVGMRRASGSGASIARTGGGSVSDVAMAATGVSTPMPSPAAASRSNAANAAAVAAHAASMNSAEFGVTSPSPAVAAASNPSSGAPTATSSVTTPSLAAPASRRRGMLVVAVFAVLGVVGTGAYVARTRSITKPIIDTPSPSPSPA